MTTTDSSPTSPMPTPGSARRGVPPSRILRTAGMIIPVTAALTAATAAIMRAALDLDAAFAGTQPGTVAPTVMVALLLATGVLVVSFRKGVAGRRFERLATGAFALSLVGPVTTLWSQPPDGPAHHRPQTMFTLIVLHLITYAAALTLAHRVGDEH